MTRRWRAAPARTAPKRKRVVPLWRDRRVLLMSGAGLALILLAFGLWSWHAGWPQRMAERTGMRMLATSAEFGFRVREVFVIGRRHTPQADLLAAIGVDRGAPILGLDLASARERIVALPWVRQASVERLLPDTVVVRLIEREPVALWQSHRRFALIDGTGTVIDVEDVGRFRDLLVVVGDDAPAHALSLLAILATEQDLKPKVEAAVRIGRRRWNLRLKGGTDVRLPERNSADAWRRLADYQRRHRLLDKNLLAVDLRFEDRLVLRWPAEVEPRELGIGEGA
jgi:cell division protein FtsQ